MEQAGSALVADVGREHVRFALVRPGGEPREVRRYANADRPTFTDTLIAYLDATGMRGERLAAVLAIAGAVHGPVINLTGSRWFVSLSGVEAVLRGPVRALNESAATALAITRLDPSLLVALPGPAPGPPGSAGQYLVLAPATGMGSAGLLGDGRGCRPVQSESAHMAFTPRTPDERRLVERLAQHGAALVTNEAVVSEAGLRAAFALFGGGASGPADDVIRAAAHDQRAAAAVDLFAGALASVAGELAMAFGAWDGVFLAGPLVRALRQPLALPGFRQRLADKPSFRRQLAQLPIAIVNRDDLQLLGAAAALDAPPAQPTAAPARWAASS